MRSDPVGMGADGHIDSAVRLARGARQRFLGKRRTQMRWRGGLLYALPLPLAPAAIVALARGELALALASVAALGLVWSGANLNRRGLLEERVARDRRYTRPWQLPYKYLGAAAVATGTGVAALGAAGHDAAGSVVFGLMAALGFHLVYGLPAPDWRAVAPHVPVGDKALRATLREAERRIVAIDKAALQVGNRELEHRLGRIAAQGRGILEQIAARPEGRTRARKFLNVYLEGAERVASHYARTHRLARPPVLEQNFRNVLIEIERVFARQASELAASEVFDLDVQIEVLRQQLRREGIR